ncbi:MAG: FimV/HubP family polar landmark protein [Leucothrix sp.]
MSAITKLHHSLTPYCLLLSFLLVSGFAPSYAASHTPRTVKAIGTLSAIVNKNYIDADATTSQIMVAILAANPEAFRGGNINFMIRNADLRLPSVESVKSISNRDAVNLLDKHYRLFKRGRTGNLAPPAFISLNDSQQVETLVKEKAQQSEKLTSLEAEREKLRTMVKRLEDEKAQRDDDLRSLEDKIQDLQSSSSSLDSATAKLKLKLANGELTGDGAKLLEELEARNQSLNAQLQSARSEMAESTRMEITLERRMSDIQEENSQLSQALKKQGVSPSEVIQQPNPTDVAVTDNSATATTSTSSIQAPATPNTAQAPSAPTATSGFTSLLEQYAGFIPKDLRWLALLLPVFLLLGLIWLVWKLLRGGRSKTTRRVQQPATTASFVDYTQPIDPELELEQEPQLEVSIKMDVARAYLEAGDLTAARGMLAEVISEGNAQQQQEASQMMAEL